MEMKYEQRTAGEWHMPIMKDYKMACCDCGLVHKFNFKVIQAKSQKTVRNKRVLIQAFRDERATAQVRRHMKKNKK